MKDFLKKLNVKCIVWYQKNIWKIPVLAAMTLVILISILMMTTVYQIKSLSDIKTAQTLKSLYITHKLEELNSQLTSLSKTSSSSKDFHLILNNLHDDLNQIQKTFSNKGDIHTLSTQIASFRNDMGIQLSDLKKALAASKGDKFYIEANQLPFKLISIDVISGQPYIGVDDQHHQFTLQIGDSLGGFLVTEADYQEGWVEFKNDHNQFIKVKIENSRS